MAFESLTERMSQAFKNLTGQGKLTEKNMNDMLKEVRMSLLEADVNYTVVKDFIARVKEKALGEEVLSALNPGQMVVKIVHEEITELLGSEEVEVHYKKSGIPRQKRFVALLEERGVTATVRRTLGSDIEASCGQLRRKVEGGTGHES